MSRINTSNSPDVQKRFLPFINVSGKKIPPFGCMQIVSDPNTRSTLSAEDSKNPWAVAFNKLPRFDRQSRTSIDGNVTLFCDQPNVVSEFYQDPAMIAFNSDAEVAVGGSGRCFYSEYPIRALSPKYSDYSMSLAIVRDRWYLFPIAGRFGCFKTYSRPEQRVKCDVTDDTGKLVPGEVRVFNVVASAAYPFAPTAEGTFSIAGIGKNPLVVTKRGYIESDRAHLNATQGYPDTAVYGTTPSLTFNVPGTYQLSFTCAMMKAAGSVGSSYQIPFDLVIVPYESKDQDRLSISQQAGGSLLYKFTNDGDGWYYLGTASGGGEKIWGRSRVSAILEVEVKSAPATIGIKQSLSPFVKTASDGEFNVRYRPPLFSDLGKLEWQHFMAYSSYYGSFVQPYLSSAFIPLVDPGVSAAASMFAFPFIDPTDPRA